MAEVATAPKPLKRLLAAENSGGDAQDASKKQRSEAPPASVAETAPTLTKDQQKLADKFRYLKKNATGDNVEAFALELTGPDEKATAYVARVSKATTKPSNTIQSFAMALNPAHKKLRTKPQTTQISNALGDLSAVAFVAAAAPQKTEEGYVAGSIDVRGVGKDTWHRFDDAESAWEDKANCGASSGGVLREALKRAKANPADPYAKQRGFEVRDVTDALRIATAENKVVRGFHEEKKKWGPRKTLTESLAVPEEEERKVKAAKAALAAADKEAEVAYRKRQYDYFGMTYSSVPPLPDGATDADRERLQREALEAFYGLSASPS